MVMGDLIDFKPRPSLPAHDLPHYHSIICDLSELTPQDRLSVIAASCADNEWQEIFELAVYCIGAEQSDRDVRQTLHSAVETVIRQATRGAS